MYEISSLAQRTSAPYSAVTYIVTDWPDGTRTRGSGVVVGTNDVLTALHVVYDQSRGGWAKGVSITPGADTTPYSAPYGSYTDFGSLAGRTTNWDTNGDGLLSDAEAQFDMALIGLRSRIGDVTGVITPLASGADSAATMMGYPARGTGLMAEAVFADASTYYGVYDINASLGAGASGGPLVENSGGTNYVVGTLSSGNSANTMTTYAGLFGAGTWEWLQSAMAANDSLLPFVPQTTFIGGSNNDTFVGSTLADSFSGGAGNDTFTGLGGNDTVDGGTGIDMAVFSGLRVSYTGSTVAGVLTVTDLVAGRDGTDTLTGVERLKFADVAIALDLDGNAGTTVKILGAVFGKTEVTSRGNAGIGLKLLDGGASYTDVMQVALNAKLGTGFTSEAEISLLYQNITGRVATADDIGFYKAQITSGQYTQASLAVMAAELPQNALNINLTGLASSGLEYTPQA